MRLKEFTDKYDPRARLIANCLWPAPKNPIISPYWKWLIAGCLLGWILGICTLAAII